MFMAQVYFVQCGAQNLISIFSLNLMATPWQHYCDCHFAEELVKAQGGKTTWSRSPNWQWKWN